MVYNNVWTLRRANLLMVDYRVDLYRLGTPKVVKKLKALGVMKPNEWWGSFCQHLLRLLLNPTPDIQSLIQSERLRIGPAQNQLGIHVRCGGNLADSNEQTWMVSPDRLKKVPDQVRKLIKASPIPRDKLYLFLSTDSTMAAGNLSVALHPYRIESSNVFYRGHSRTQFVDNKSLIRSYVDLFLLCQSRSALLTSSSSFSRLITIMSIAAPKWYISAKRFIS